MNHEGTQLHFSSTAAWKTFEKQLKSSALMDQVSERSLQTEIHFWKKVLHGILEAIIFLAKNNLAFRGSSSNLMDRNCGNFLSLIKLLSNYSPHLATHVERMKKKSISYLSPDIQNEFIIQCGNWVRKSILEDVRRAKYFSTLIDSTPDSSKKEQISQIVRYVQCTKDGCIVKESFIDFIASEEKTGIGLSNVVIQKLKRDDLEIQDCRGQGYDNGANMAGAYNGVQKWILNISPKAQFIPCAAHSLNLVGVNAAERVLPAKLILGQIQNVFLYFHGSTSRWQFLNSKLNCNLKGQSTTRWSSRAQAVEALSEQYWNVVETLVEIINSDDFNADSIAGADAQLNVIMTFKFLLSVKIWNRLLYQINVCSLTLQKESRNLDMASKKLEALLLWLKDFRIKGFKECLLDASAVAEKYGIDSSSGFEDKRSTRGVKRKRLEEKADDSVKTMTNLQKFELNFFNELLDNLVSEMGSRFSQVKSCSEDFGFLWGTAFATGNDEYLEKCVKDLCLRYEGDLDAVKFANEVKYLKYQISSLLPEGKTLKDTLPTDILDIIYQHELQSCFPNVACAIQIFLTLPVTVASSERSFSKLKIIKNFLRSSMGQERLSNLGILSIEHEVTDRISFEEMISTFATTKCRKASLV